MRIKIQVVDTYVVKVLVALMSNSNLFLSAVVGKVIHDGYKARERQQQSAGQVWPATCFSATCEPRIVYVLLKRFLKRKE